VEFSLERVAVGGGRVLRVRGELDLATAPELDDAVLAELSELTGTVQPSPPARTSPGPTPLVIDLTATAFMDSSGARALVHAVRNGAGLGVRVSVACPAANTRVRRVIDILQLATVIPISETVQTSGEAST
jgi:anti-sigma B factor antagonist